MGALAELAVDLRCALDPVAFAQRCGLTPDPWQARVLRDKSHNWLLNCCRQSGKSTTAATLALHTAVYHDGALVLLLSPSLRQSSELFRKVADLYGQVAESVPSEAESALRLELANGSRIVSLPGKEATIRGYSGVALLICDEAARIDDALYFSVRPMLAVSGGRLVLMSTPFGKRGHFHETWTHGGDAWERVEVPATECPRISAEFLEEERAAMGDWWFRQEYLCEFVDTVDQVFGYDLVMGALSGDVEPLFGGEA